MTVRESERRSMLPACDVILQVDRRKEVYGVEIPGEVFDIIVVVNALAACLQSEAGIEEPLLTERKVRLHEGRAYEVGSIVSVPRSLQPANVYQSVLYVPRNSGNCPMSNLSS